MFNPRFDELFFTSHFINGLKEEIKHVVQSQLPDTVDRAALLARIQQQALEKSKAKHSKWHPTKAGAPKPDANQANIANPLWKERQVRDYRRTNNLCHFCGDKFEPGHLQKCPKRLKPQVNALALVDMNMELSEETLNQLQIEDTPTEEMGQLSLNAIAGTKSGDAMRIRALVKKKVMLILVDSGSSHSFISESFVQNTGLTPTQSSTMQVRVANGQLLSSTSHLDDMEWWSQGYTFHTTMRVLGMTAYDAILGYDWLKAHSPMVCNWNLKTMEFQEGNQIVLLQGVKQVQHNLTTITPEQVIKWHKGNDIWALAVVQQVPLQLNDHVPGEIQQVLENSLMCSLNLRSSHPTENTTTQFHSCLM
jgi:hypothetical protein